MIIFARMETLEYHKSQRGISKKDITNTRNELVRLALHIINAFLFFGSIYVLLALENSVYLELAKATLLLSLVLFIHLASKDSNRVSKNNS